jgi:hypothetical protein
LHAGKAARSKDREIIDAINQSLRPADKGLRPLHLMDLRVAGIPLATARTLIHSLDALKAVQDAAAKAVKAGRRAAHAASRAARAPAAAGSVPPAGGAVASEACNAFLYPPPGSSSSELHIGGVSQAYFVFVFIFVFRRRVTQARLDAAAKPPSDAAAPLPTFSIGAVGARLCCDGGVLSAPHAGARTRAGAYNASDKGKAYNASDKAKAAKKAASYSAPVLRPLRCARWRS